MKRLVAFLLLVIVVPAVAQTVRDRLMQTVESLTASDLPKWQQRAKSGDSEAQTVVALVFQRGKLVNENQTEATRLLRLAADRGYAPAQNALGVSYQMGWGAARDIDEAAKLYRAAAKQNYAAAQFNLGNLYFEEIVHGETDEAYAWWTVAAENGDTSASDALTRLGDRIQPARVSYLLGKKYVEGIDFPRDVERGMKYLAAADEGGDTDAAILLGLMYVERGDRVQDGIRLLEQAAHAGAPAAALQLGDLYATGKLGNADPKQAIKWYENALSPDTPEAFSCLGSVYATGKGVNADRVTGAMYLLLGYTLGNKDCKQQLDTLALTPGELKKAKDKASKWLKEDKHGDVWAAVYRPKSR